MGFLIILTALAFSVDWAAWDTYVKPGPRKLDKTITVAGVGSDEAYYYEKAWGCHKGYVIGNITEQNSDGNAVKAKCIKCSKLSKDEIGGVDESYNPVPCKDYKGTDEDGDNLGCYCKDKKWNAGSCPAQQKALDKYYKKSESTKNLQKWTVEAYKKAKKYAAYADKDCMFHGCMPYGSKARCSGLAVWAFILIVVLAVLVVVAIVVVVIIVILKLRGGKPTTKVDPAPTEAKSAAPVAEAPPEVVGPSVLIKLGKQEIRTKKAADGPTAVWGEAVVFTGVGAEDDDVTIEVNGNSGDLLGSAELRIPEYVNNKKRAVLTLKNGEADAGVLEIDIEIQVQEEPEVKITGVFFVDKYTK